MMKRKIVVIILTVCMALALLPFKIANASDESEDNLKADYNLQNIAISYDDLPILFSLSPNLVSDYFPVKNAYPLSEKDYFEDVQDGSYSDGTNTWDYSLDVWDYQYGYVDSSGYTHGNNFQITAPAGGEGILWVDMGGAHSSYHSFYDEPVGLRNIKLGDSYAVVLTKLGLDTNLAGCMDIELHINADGDNGGWANRNHGLWGNPSNEPNIRFYFGDFWQDRDSLYVEFWFYGGEQLNFVRYSNWKLLKQLILDSNGQKESEISLPADKLQDITNIASAIIVLKLANDGCKYI